MKDVTLGKVEFPVLGSRFQETHWSVVLAAAQADPARRIEALETLCRTYWEPIYYYLRFQGHNVQDAEDLTQGFLARLLQQGRMQDLKPEGGKFRSFLLAALKNYAADCRDHAHAAKRGGGQVVLSLDHEVAEKSFAQEAIKSPAPEHLFDRRWAATVMNRAFTGLQQELAAAGKTEQFLELAVFLGAEGTAEEYETAGGKLSMTRGAVAVAVHRLRQRYRELIRAEIAQTISSPAELDGEMRYLLEIICQ